MLLNGSRVEKLIKQWLSGRIIFSETIFCQVNRQNCRYCIENNHITSAEIKCTNRNGKLTSRRAVPTFLFLLCHDRLK
jgi:hypothetical protein